MEQHRSGQTNDEKNRMVSTSANCSPPSMPSKARPTLRSSSSEPGTNGSTVVTIELRSLTFTELDEDHHHEQPFVLDEDEHQVLLGEDQGPNPVEYLLAGLIGCLTSSLVYHAAARGIEHKGREVEAGR